MNFKEDIQNFEQRWKTFITRPDWYSYIIPEYKELLKLSDDNLDLQEKLKERMYDFFEDHLEKGTIALAKEGSNFDEERKTIDTIVIHHTSKPPGITWQRLNAIQLLTLYGLYYFQPKKAEKYLKRKPVWSNHFRDNQQVFYAYHWLVRMDGSVERLLEDHQIGWQAGDWDINCRSIAISLDNDYEKDIPSSIVLASVTQLIKKHYPEISMDRIFGHCEINQKTICPGKKFENQWKGSLLQMIKLF